MTKKKVILVAAAALFAVSGLTALPSGNITGGVGCIDVYKRQGLCRLMTMCSRRGGTDIIPE